MFVKGLFCGFVLVGAASALRMHISPRLLRAINVVSGIVILAFAGWQLGLILR